jgi:hypothetical protein
MERALGFGRVRLGLVDLYWIFRLSRARKRIKSFPTDPAILKQDLELTGSCFNRADFLGFNKYTLDLRMAFMSLMTALLALLPINKPLVSYASQAAPLKSRANLRAM